MYSVCRSSWPTKTPSLSMLGHNVTLALSNKKKIVDPHAGAIVKPKTGNFELSMKPKQCLCRNINNCGAKTMDKQYGTHWKEAETHIWDMQESNNAQVHQLAESLRQNKFGTPGVAKNRAETIECCAAEKARSGAPRYNKDGQITCRNDGRSKLPKLPRTRLRLMHCAPNSRTSRSSRPRCLPRWSPWSRLDQSLRWCLKSC